MFKRIYSKRHAVGKHGRAAVGAGFNVLRVHVAAAHNDQVFEPPLYHQLAINDAAQVAGA